MLPGTRTIGIELCKYLIRVTIFKQIEILRNGIENTGTESASFHIFPLVLESRFWDALVGNLGLMNRLLERILYVPGGHF